MPARHVAETLQRHQRDAEVAQGRQVEEAGAEAVIDSAHQDRQDDEPPEPEPVTEAGSAAPERQPAGSSEAQGAPGESKPDSGDERPAPAEPPAGLARIRTAAANATSRLLGVTRAMGGGTAATAPRTDHDSNTQDTSRDPPDAGVQLCHATATCIVCKTWLRWQSLTHSCAFRDGARLVGHTCARRGSVVLDPRPQNLAERRLL